LINVHRMTKRESILKAATMLFAEHSYDSVGIRDIAKEAGVNSAMISYYFGGKSGLHQEIFARFIHLVLEVSKVHLGRARNTHELCECMCPAFLDSARQNRGVYLVGLRSLNRDLEWLREEQDRLLIMTEEYITGFLSRTGHREKMPYTRKLVFGAVMGMLFSDYLLGGGANINEEELFQGYVETIIQILRYGLPSLVG